MLKLDGRYFSTQFTYGVWMLMAFQAGYVNVGGLHVSGNFVSHVTGTSSRIGMGIASLDLTVLATFCTVLLAFIGGAAFAGYYIGHLRDSGKDPRYVFVLSVKAFFFGLVLLLSENDLIHLLNMPQEQINLLIIFFLSFCCGVQNATCALSTKGFLKPTHMTGLSTDIGIALAKVFSKEKDDSASKSDVRKVQLRWGILGSFIFGGSVSAMIFSHNGHYGFLFPFVSSMCFLMLGIARDLRKMGANSLVFRAAKGSVVATFLTTLAFGLNAYMQTF